jgi:hypothetical protein
VQRPIKDALDREEETGTALTHSQRYKYEPKKFLVSFSGGFSRRRRGNVPRVAEMVMIVPLRHHSRRESSSGRLFPILREFFIDAD